MRRHCGTGRVTMVCKGGDAVPDVAKPCSGISLSVSANNRPPGGYLLKMSFELRARER